MQEIIADRKVLRNIIPISNCSFKEDHLYAYWYNELRILVKVSNHYYWRCLDLRDNWGYGGDDGYASPREAIQYAINTLPIDADGKNKVFKFENQEELRKWWATY